MLIGNTDLVELNNKGEDSITEDKLKDVLGRYALSESLLFFGTTSKLIFEFSTGKKSNYEILGLGGIRDSSSGAIITQFALGYLANLLIISRSNDWKSKPLVENGKNNLEILSNIYNNCLINRDRHGDRSIKNIKSLLIRLYQEQITIQFFYADLIARNYVIFCKIIKDNPRFNYLNETFLKINGISIEDYLYIGMSIFAIVVSQEPIFNIIQLTNSTATTNNNRLSKTNIDAFLKIRSVDYKKFREVDEEKNSSHIRLYTKTRYNPLIRYPVIKIQNPIRTKNYVVPNLPLYVRSVFDLFWHFDDYFVSISPGEQTGYRNIFGEIFELYIKQILEYIYGDNRVHGEIKYKTSKGEIKFLDFYIEVEDKIYIFEIKASRFRLPTLQRGLEDGLIDEEINKFIKPVLQIKDRFNDIQNHEELIMFRDKKLVPFIIFFDLPFVNDAKFYEEVLQRTDDGKETLRILEKFKINCLNISDLEKYAEHSDAVSLEKIFSEINKNPKVSGVSIESSKYPKNTREIFLIKQFNDFNDGVVNNLKLSQKK